MCTYYIITSPRRTIALLFIMKKSFISSHNASFNRHYLFCSFNTINRLCAVSPLFLLAYFHYMSTLLLKQHTNTNIPNFRIINFFNTVFDFSTPQKIRKIQTENSQDLVYFSVFTVIQHEP